MLNRLRIQIIQRPFSWHEFMRNFGIGAIVAVLLFLFPDLPLLMDKEDEYMDWMMELRVKANNILPPIEDKSHSFVFLDIDDKTYQAWDEPLFTPRERLEFLIINAVKAKAHLLVVDIDISQPTPVERSLIHPEDKALKEYLEEYVAQCREEQEQSKCPPIIFVRAFTAPQNSEQILVPRTGFLEDTITQGAPYLQWGSAHFYQSEDWVVRRWQLWQEACLDEQPQVVPSIELLAMAIIKENCSVEQVQTALKGFEPNCDKDIVSKQQLKTVEICGIRISTKPRDLNQRVMYSMVLDNHQTSVMTENNKVILRKYSAAPYTYASSQVNLNELTDRIVVIGGSYSNGRDVYLTPVGEMPGPLIVINAIHSLLEYDVIGVLPIWWENALITLGLILVLSFILARFCSIVGLLLGAGIIFGIMIFIVVEWLNQGIWLNFVLPLIAVEFAHALGELSQECRTSD